jgi:hypothetical protein
MMLSNILKQGEKTFIFFFAAWRFCVRIIKTAERPAFFHL